MNLLSFDIEEWALAKSGGYGTAERYAEYDAFLEKFGSDCKSDIDNSYKKYLKRINEI